MTTMSLPKIQLPIYETEIPSTGEKVKYRVFTVKEEKILLIAKESEDPKENAVAMKQVLNNCIIDKNVNDLAVFDIEYILLQIRGKSVSNTVEFKIVDPETEEDVNLRVDITNIKIHKNPLHSNKIKLNDEYTMFMKYPNYDLFAILAEEDLEEDSLKYYNLMVSCIEKVVSKETVYRLSEFSQQEIETFMENLESDVIDKIKLFFETMPTIRHEVKYTNSKGNEKTFVIEGTDSFFI